jgi:S-DNA-T family DNA segregation ATPase FtsK/SpoIIIE
VGQGRRRRFRRGAVTFARFRASSRERLAPVLHEDSDEELLPSGRWLRDQPGPRPPGPVPVVRPTAPARAGDGDDDSGDEDGVRSSGGVVRDGPEGVMPPRPVRDEDRSLGDQTVRPVLPPWTRDPWTNVRWALRYALHVTAFHLLRIPTLYVPRLLGWSPRGLVRATVGLSRWVGDVEAKEPIWSAVAANNRKDYKSLTRHHDQRVHNRMWVVGILATIVLAVTVIAGWLSPWSPLVRWVTVAVWVGVLGWVGAPADRPMVSSAKVPDRVRRIDSDLLVQAFAAAGLSSLDRDTRPGPIDFAEPVHRDRAGYRAVIDLPPSRVGTADEAIARRDQIAAGLAVDESRVHLSRVRGTIGSARRVVIWVADQDPSEKPPAQCPLVAAASWDFWKGVPFGTDPRGGPVTVRLVGSNLLMGGIPDMGKTNAAREVAAAGALDPHVQLIIFDGKGGKDWKPFAQVAYFYEAGLRDAVVDRLVAVLRRLVEEMERRFAVIAELDDDICPDAAVTPSITRQRRFGMPLILLVIDEAHEYFADERHGAEIEVLCVRLVKRARAVGIMQLIATQNPSVENIPSDLRKQVGTRFALKTMDSDSSDAILGKGSNKAGLSSAKLRRSDKGVGILHGADGANRPDVDDGPNVVRTYLLDIPDLRRLCDRARDLRTKAGTLAGAAAGEIVIDDTPRRRVLDDVLDVFAAGEDQLHSDVIAARLGRRWSDTYHGWDPGQLAKALGNWGIETTQTWAPLLEDPATKGNRMGVRRDQILDALNATTDSAHTGPPNGGIPVASRPELEAPEPLDPGPTLDPVGSSSRPPSDCSDQDSSPLGPDP